MHIIMPAAGRMCLKIMSSGIFSTYFSRPLRVRRLTRMFVPNPKKAFQSPGTHSFGLAVMVMGRWFGGEEKSGVLRHERLQRGDDRRRFRDPAEDPALRLN